MRSIYNTGSTKYNQTQSNTIKNDFNFNSLYSNDCTTNDASVKLLKLLMTQPWSPTAMTPCAEERLTDWWLDAVATSWNSTQSKP